MSIISSVPGSSPEEFIWAGGIEDTFVPQTRAGHRALDEYELIGHYDHWREDLALARALGLDALRWGVPWYKVEPAQGEFDWRWIDQVIPYMIEELGITPIIDLMHYGCPFWLKGEFANPGYPTAVASYAAAFAQRYSQLIKWYTPLNEPLVNASLCGRRGAWPPYLRGSRGYVRIIMQLAKGILATVGRVKQIDPASIMLHVEASGRVISARSELESIRLEEEINLYLVYDLITGKVTPEHHLFAWLLMNGASLTDLLHLQSEPIALDMIGLNFYPQWSTRELYANARGHLDVRAADREGQGFGDMIETYYNRYRVPVFISETSAYGSDAARAAWLARSMSDIRSLRQRGVPVLGYTWFPLFTMYDWRYRHGRANLESYRLELGMYNLGDNAGARWLPTPLVEQFHGLRQSPYLSIGSLFQAPS